MKTLKNQSMLQRKIPSWGLRAWFSLPGPCLLVPEQVREGETGLCPRTLLARPRLPWAEKWGSPSPKNRGDRLREEGKMRQNWIQKNAANPATAQLVHPSFRVQKVYVWWYTCKFQSSQQVFFSVQYNKQNGWAIFFSASNILEFLKNIL